jgi:hypothetical protein
VEEHVDHALLFCPFARQVWDEVKESFDIYLNRNDFRSPKMWLFDFLGRCSRQEGTVLAVTFWHLWDARNKLREEGGSVHPTSIATKIKVYVDLIISQLVSSDSDHMCGTSRVVSWSPPPKGFLMVNVDAAIFESSSCMRAGVVIHDSAGKFVGTYGECTRDVTSPELAEALAIRSAVLFAADEGLDKLILLQIAYLWFRESMILRGIDQSTDQ